MKMQKMHRALLVVALMTPASLYSAALTGSQISPTEWDYNLIFAPEDNYSITQPATTITLTGLSGLTGAAGPQTTTFPSGLDTVNLDWTAAVLDGGTEVVWTHVGPGTGNFPVSEEVDGFQVFAAGGGVSGIVDFATSGISTDIPDPVNRDVSGTIIGPTASNSSVPEPSSALLLGGGLSALGIVRRVVGRRRTRSGSTEHI